MTTPDWDKAECAQEDPELFFPEATFREAGSIREARRQAKVAASVCADCPIRRECAAWAVAQGVTDGVWGGMWIHKGRHDTWLRGPTVTRPR